MTVADARRTRSGWRVRVQGQGRATAKVGTLGDAKRAGEAIAQRPLVWERRSADRWTGREPSREERENLERLYELARNDDA